MQEVQPDKILETAMELISSAQKSIRMTMQAQEELERPLPENYFLLLKKKLDEGIRIERVGFGSDEDFTKLGERVLFKHTNYYFNRTAAADYQRMLLIDDSKLMFAKTDESGRHVYFTEDNGVISDFKHYLTSHTA